MQLTKARRPCGEHPLKKANRRGCDNRHIPSLRKGALFLGELFLAVILQQNAVAQDFAVFSGVLLRQRNKRKHNDNPPLTVRDALAQSKMQQRQRFARSGRSRQRINPRLPLSGPSAGLEQLVAKLIQFAVRVRFFRKLFTIIIQLPEPLLRIARGRFGNYFAIFFRRGGVVRIYQAGKQHACPEHAGFALLPAERRVNQLPLRVKRANSIAQLSVICLTRQSHFLAAAAFKIFLLLHAGLKHRF